MKNFRKLLALTMVLVLIISTGCQKKSLYEERLEGSLFTSHQGLIYFDKDHIFVQCTQIYNMCRKIKGTKK